MEFVIIALLKIIDNPYQDISLACVLRSPLVGASLGELAQIRLTDKLQLFDGLEKWVAANPDDPAAEHRPLDDRAYALDHFRAKLLKLADGFQTGTGARIAAERTETLARFVAEFEAEI